MSNEMSSGSDNELQMRFLACKIREHEEHLLQLRTSRCTNLESDCWYSPKTKRVAIDSINEIQSYDFDGIYNANESVFRTYGI